MTRGIERSATIAVSARAQAAGAIVACIYVFLLHIDNDGLWYQGDAPRHALNGLFWWDLITGGLFNPKEFGLRYFARYPAITPHSYPPIFYLLEGGAFRVFGPSPLVAKGIVLAFAVLGALYVCAWLRRWVSPQAGWAAALLPLQPGVVVWTNAVMLNVPSMSLAVAALYHAARWLDEPAPRHLYLAVALATLTALTYFPAAVVGAVLIIWLFSEGRWKTIFRSNRGLLALLFVFAGIFLVGLLWFAPMQLSMALPHWGRLKSLKSILFYGWALTDLLSPSLLGLALFAVPAGLLDLGSRRQIVRLTIWVAAMYLGLSYILAREARYALPLVPAFVILATIGLSLLVRFVVAPLGQNTRRCFLAILAGFVLLEAWLATTVRVQRVRGFEEVVQFFEEVDPDGRFLYEGTYDGVFTFYLRARDPEFRRTVVRGSKLLYASAVMPMWRLTERVSSPGEVVEVLKKECGCRWVAIEDRKIPDRVDAVEHLRTALEGPEFELVRSFPIQSSVTTRVDVYRVVMPIEVPETLRLPFPVLGEGRAYRAAPIER